uniref:Sesquisabinene B synthase 1 n=1 Tax=Santalum album TaxID=35974 RepID=A0A0A0RDR2_SANAL|nr:Chain A, Sesquisabinene B synthase 1 [Santalum album]6A1E_A Chain A, Sesquisabinene B synthase 1 [Santalum album]6A1I_A Chain A, Sesquisabinene B synthase 1 [Santalum album]6A3X_A Chain A, Sesquisabinene B synthase 1 [Santalum album]6O9P_A Chain A, Sesquisabinene B synthase 1 [Santalum album]6O9Q_A Chain A, Sesquisabinene B synthase 1 [Santalum album]AIV42939.1 sesquisabinene B synthase 1 [Santalum album]
MDLCQIPPTSPISPSVPFNGDDSSVVRRSANYPANLWDYDFLQSLGRHSSVTEEHVGLAEKLKGEVKSLITGPMEPLAKLEFIDSVRRLGLKYQFETEMKEALANISKDGYDSWWVDNLRATALRFRLLRENGIFVPQDVFERFQNKETGKFKNELCEDVKGLLNLYEASFLGWEGEDILDEARTFSTAQLKNVEGKISSPNLAKIVHHALDLPLHWRAIRYEARWFIDIYEDEEDMNPTLLKYAKLDFNIVQSFHQAEIGRLARWWVGTGLDKLPFARNGLIQSYMYAIGMLFEPHLGEVREMEAKVGALITTIDDVYDVYGTMEELELFTDITERWDINRVDQLPRNIRMPLLTMFNTSNDIGYWALKERGFNGIPYTAKVWADQLKSYTKEAKWFHEGHKPTLEEYLENALVSIGFPNLLVTSYLLTVDNPTKEKLDYVDSLPLFVRASCILCRIINDLGTSPDEMERGDNLKSIQCYMNETGASQEVAREHIEGLVRMWWKRLNKCLFEPSPFTEPFLSFTINVVRGSHFFYQYGDGYGNAESWTKNQGMSVLIHPITLDEE